MARVENRRALRLLLDVPIAVESIGQPDLTPELTSLTCASTRW